MPSKPPYNAVTGAVLDELRSALGEECVLTDEETLARCASDETEDFVFSPEVVDLPADGVGGSRVLRIAWDHDIPVTPRGGGTGLSGGALPVHGGIVLSTE